MRNIFFSLLCLLLAYAPAQAQTLGEELGGKVLSGFAADGNVIHFAAVGQTTNGISIHGYTASGDFGKVTRQGDFQHNFPQAQHTPTVKRIVKVAFDRCHDRSYLGVVLNKDNGGDIDQTLLTSKDLGKTWTPVSLDGILVRGDRAISFNVVYGQDKKYYLSIGSKTYSSTDGVAFNTTSRIDGRVTFVTPDNSPVGFINSKGQYGMLVSGTRETLTDDKVVAYSVQSTNSQDYLSAEYSVGNPNWVITHYDNRNVLFSGPNYGVLASKHDKKIGLPGGTASKVYSMETYQQGYFVAARRGAKDFVYRISLDANPSGSRVFMFDQVFEPVYESDIFLPAKNAGIPQLLFRTPQGLFLQTSHDDVKKWNGSTFVVINPPVSDPVNIGSQLRPVRPNANPNLRPATRPTGKSSNLRRPR